MNWVEENLALFLPEYLSGPSQRNLIDAIKQFPANIDDRLYCHGGTAESSPLQGDGVFGLTMGHVESRRFIELPCMLLSNSCDMDLTNAGMGTGICYAPIFRLDKYRGQVENELGKARAAGYIESLREQRVTQCMYLPKGNGLQHEGIVMFDQMTSRSSTALLQHEICEKRSFRLSQYGFYLLLFKLSIHFTRMGEAARTF